MGVTVAMVVSVLLEKKRRGEILHLLGRRVSGR
jgi:hypothetical protein